MSVWADLDSFNQLSPLLLLFFFIPSGPARAIYRRRHAPPDAIKAHGRIRKYANESDHLNTTHTHTHRPTHTLEHADYHFIIKKKRSQIATKEIN